jgi:hypothetical protein
LTEEHRLRVFKNKLLTRIFGTKREEGWRELRNKELHNLYSSSYRTIKSRRMKDEHAEPIGETRNACRVLERNPEGKRPLGRPRRRWEDNVKKYFKEIGC